MPSTTLPNGKQYQGASGDTPGSDTRRALLAPHICDTEGCNFMAWSNGYCRDHGGVMTTSHGNDTYYHMPCDTGYPGMLLCDTGVPGIGPPHSRQEPQHYWGAHAEEIIPIRCSYCGVRALPEDRFCEGCGAPV